MPRNNCAVSLTWCVMLRDLAIPDSPPGCPTHCPVPSKWPARIGRKACSAGRRHESRRQRRRCRAWPLAPPLVAQQVAPFARPEAGVLVPREQLIDQMAAAGSGSWSARICLDLVGVGSVPIASKRRPAQKLGVGRSLAGSDPELPPLGQHQFVDVAVGLGNGRRRSGGTGGRTGTVTRAISTMPT